MRTLKNMLKLAPLLVAAVSFSVSAQTSKATAVKTNKVYLTVEKSPQFPGGAKALSTYLSKTVQYPAIDRESNIQGKVYVSFVVETNGKLSGVTAVRGPSATLKAEAVRVISKSPTWKPGVHGGKLVRTRYTVPVNFTLSDEGSSVSKSASVKPMAPVVKGQHKGDVFVSVEKSPFFPGGPAQLGEYLSKNIKYPTIDRENNIQGKVYVQFVVEPDGSLTGVNAVRGPSESLKAEAVRVIKMSPKWVAGVQDGKRVRVQYTLPVNFALGA